MGIVGSATSMEMRDSMDPRREGMEGGRENKWKPYHIRGMQEE